MMTRDRYIADLVEKFLDGHTTNSQERELYIWFSTHDVPEEWMPLKSMFAWYEAGMPDEGGEAKVDEAVAEVRPAKIQRRTMPLRRWLQVVGGCAAAIVIVIVLFGSHTSQDVDDHSGNVDVVATIDDDLMQRADLLEQQAYELLAWAEMNSL
jgi:hypothetical protein